MRKILTMASAVAILAACSQVNDGVDKAASSVNDIAEQSQQASETAARKVIKAVKVSPEVARLMDMAKTGRYGYKITESLTTEIGPRLAGSPEEAKARDWAVAKFKELGLENVRIEEFSVPGWIRGEETASIVSPNPQKLYITSLGGSVATPPQGIEADIAYFPTFEDLEAAPMGGLEGKIVFISGRMEKHADGAGYGPANRKRRSGATEAGKRGALAVVIRSVGTDSHRFPHTGQMRYGEDVKPIPIAALSAPDADQLERSLRGGQDVRIKMTLTPQTVGDLPSGNVIGEIVGSERPEEVILISGHLDSWDQGTGALDDGAGIGISAGAAQIILEAGLKPKRTIRVVAFGAEEIGLKGGYAYVEAHRDDLPNHMLATESDFGADLVYEIKSGVKGKSGHAVLEQLAGIMGVPMSDARSNGGPDIGPMHNEGVPAMRLQQDGTDYFDFHHTPDDTFDKIDPEKMAQNTGGFAVLAWLAANAETNFRED